MRWLAALACVAALLLAGCGEKHDVLEPTGSKHIELMLDYFPNADHAGRRDPPAARPGGADQAGCRRPGRSRDLLRA